MVRLRGMERNSSRHQNSRSLQVVANLERKMAFTDKPHWIGHDASRVRITTHTDLTWTNGFYKKVLGC